MLSEKENAKLFSHSTEGGLESCRGATAAVTAEVRGTTPPNSSTIVWCVLAVKADL